MMSSPFFVPVLGVVLQLCLICSIGVVVVDSTGSGQSSVNPPSPLTKANTMYYHLIPLKSGQTLRDAYRQHLPQQQPSGPRAVAPQNQFVPQKREEDLSSPRLLTKESIKPRLFRIPSGGASSENFGSSDGVERSQSRDLSDTVDTDQSAELKDPVASKQQSEMHHGDSPLPQNWSKDDVENGIDKSFDAEDGSEKKRANKIWRNMLESGLRSAEDKKSAVKKVWRHKVDSSMRYMGIGK